MKRCENCGNILPDDAKFCNICGSRVDGVQDQNVSDSKFQSQGTTVLNDSQAYSDFKNEYNNNSVNYAQENDNSYFEPASQPAQQSDYYAPQSVNQAQDSQSNQNYQDNTYNQVQPQTYGTTDYQNNYYQNGNSQQSYNPNQNNYQNAGFQNQNYSFQSQNFAVAPKKSMIEAYKDFWKNYANFNGRARRSDYWLVYLMNSIISAVLLTFFSIMCVKSGIDLSDMEYGEYSGSAMTSSIVLFILFIVMLLYILATIIPNLSITVRRLHDQGKGGVYILMLLIPAAGSIIMFIYMCQDGQPMPNQYGPSPKYITSPQNMNYSQQMYN